MAGNKNSGDISTYKPVYAGKRLKDYLKTCEDTEKKKVVQENTEKGYKMYKNVLKVNLPTVEGYAKFLKKGRQTLYDWAKAHPEFARALERIKSEQKQKLIESGLEGTYNPTIAKLMLSGNHNVREKSDVTSGDEPLNIFSDDQINKIGNRIARRISGDGNTPSKKESD